MVWVVLSCSTPWFEDKPAAATATAAPSELVSNEVDDGELIPSVTNASEIGSPVSLSLTVTVKYDFSPIFTGFYVNEYSTKNCFDTCELSSQSTIPSNNDENLPPAISLVMLQKLSPSVAIPSSPS